MAVYTFKANSYAMKVYLYGSERLTARDGFAGVPSEYYVPVEQSAAKNFTLIETDKALANGWITQQEYDETISYRTETSPTQAVKFE
ncbi:hypothetical protein [Fictibacillus sp. 26RED30]|uniref:hypothetical protein n=1 Tax=Fictibacillus sp. 26RED30 TaxID=2745877 RepID=UPI0018CE3809|nr:hypothetical protein [Fictibacillus sp. 26RED30]MBH0159891.1 hypothetical protein [Fictibacillus sp. 26RED30]